MAIDITQGKILGKGGGTQLLVAGTMNPSQDLLWTVPYNGGFNGGNGCLMIIRWHMNHWDNGSWYKINEGYYYFRGSNTTYQRYGLREVAGTGSSNWSNGHLDITINGSGGTAPNNQRMLIQYDADGAPAYGSSYILDIQYTGTLGDVIIS
tara:strand:- start:259 stop:711 length:453 start_codon:yes stop_codon:yes gene_type:complete